MWKNRLSAFFAGLNAVVAVELSKWLVSSEIRVPLPITLILAALIAAISQRIMEALTFELPLNFQYTRMLIDFIPRVEGYWFEEICAYY